MTRSVSGELKALQRASLAAGLVIARAGLANVLPTYGVLPRTGTFALDWFRPLFSWLCFLSFMIWDALRQAREGRLTVLHVAAYAVALGLMSWICYDYYVIAKVLKDSFMFLSAREAWLAGIAYYASFFLAVFFEAEKQASPPPRTTSRSRPPTRRTGSTCCWSSAPSR